MSQLLTESSRPFTIAVAITKATAVLNIFLKSFMSLLMNSSKCRTPLYFEFFQTTIVDRYYFWLGILHNFLFPIQPNFMNHQSFDQANETQPCVPGPTGDPSGDVV